MECPQCHHGNPTGSSRCAKCNAPLEVKGGSSGSPSGGWSIQKAPAEGATSAFVSSASIQPGTVLGERYEIIQLLGEGGMGAVYKAKDRAVDRFVALKVIRSELAFHPEILQRFKQELVLARQITHKNVIRIFDCTEAPTSCGSIILLEIAKRARWLLGSATGNRTRVSRLRISRPNP